MSRRNRNICKMSDSYKASHAPQYPPGTTQIISYLESRGGMFNETVFFGLQYYIKKYLVGKLVTPKKIKEARIFWNQHFGFEVFDDATEARWMHIVTKYNGRLPIKIRAVKEGEIVPTKNVMLVIECTDPECFWLVNFLETLILKVWYPITVASLSRECKKVIHEFLVKTGDPNLISFKLHDFGYRGVSSEESAGIGGMAHLINFLGTDTVKAIDYGRKYYNTTAMLGFSIPATEHSTITSWLKSREGEAYRNFLSLYPGEATIACVSDSFDIENAVANIWGGDLKDIVMSRKGTLVIRPDSGDPKMTILRLLDIMAEKFGYTVNDLGFKVLDPHVRLIQGDGVNIKSIRVILQAMMEAGYSADNLAFGMGGKLLQGVDRDTQNFAIKCCLAIVNGETREVEKAPTEINEFGEKTQSFKKSKKGYLGLVVGPDGILKTVESHIPLIDNDILQVVFENGESFNESTFEEVRERAAFKPDRVLETA